MKYQTLSFQKSSALVPAKMNNELDAVKDSLRQIANRLDAMSRAGTSQPGQSAGQGMLNDVCFIAFLCAN